MPTTAPDAIAEYLRRPRLRGALHRPDRMEPGLTPRQRWRAAFVAAALAERERLSRELDRVEGFLRREGVE